MKRFIVITTLILAGSSLLAMGALVNASDPAPGKPAEIDSPADVQPQTAPPAKVLLDVEGMSCGGCVFTIQSALSAMDGITDVQVDVAAGTTLVAYDPETISNTDAIARAITDGGYPARIARAFSAEQVARERQMADTRAATVIASIGGFDIPRADFEADLAHAQSRYQSLYGPKVFSEDRGQRFLNNLKGQIVRQMVTEGIQLREIQSAGFTVGREKIDHEFAAYLDQRGMTRSDFESKLAENGFRIERFRKRFENRVLIEAYVEEKVVAGATSEAERQQRYTDWLDNARLLAEVVYYDRELAALGKNRTAGGGCGSSCSAGR